MNKDKRIRVGIVGVGGIARGQHIPGYQRCADAEITMLCDIDEEALETAGRTYGVPRLTTDYRELVASNEVDAVSVCTSNDMHHPVSMEAIAHGKHVFCEKPLGLNYRETQEMYQAAKAAGVVTGVGFVHRCTPASRLAQRLISSGALGDIYHVIAVYAFGGTNFGERPLTWRRIAEKAGAGLLFDLGAHMVDMTRWWLGQDITSVCARTRTFFKKARLLSGEGWGEVTTDDAACFITDFEGGAIGTFVNSALFTARGFDQRIEVYGSQGAIRYDQSKPYELMACVGREMVELYSVRGALKEEPYPRVPVPGDLRDRWPRPSLSPDFISAILDRGDFMPTFYDGMAVQRVLDAALRSSKENCWIDLSPEAT